MRACGGRSGRLRHAAGMSVLPCGRSGVRRTGRAPSCRFYHLLYRIIASRSLVRSASAAPYMAPSGAVARTARSGSALRSSALRRVALYGRTMPFRCAAGRCAAFSGSAPHGLHRMLPPCAAHRSVAPCRTARRGIRGLVSSRGCGASNDRTALWRTDACSIRCRPCRGR